MILPSWLRGSLVLVVTLGAGVALGAGIERHWGAAAHRMTATETHHLLVRFHDELKLDLAQHAAIVGIMNRHQLFIDSTWRTLRPHVRASMDSLLREIAGVLRPDQLGRYRAMIAERHPGVVP